jgi:hypothetical protein
LSNSRALMRKAYRVQILILSYSPTIEIAVGRVT